MPPSTVPGPAPTGRPVRVCCRVKPASLPADTAGRRVADAAVRLGDVGGGWLLVGVIVGLFVLSAFLPVRGALALDVAAFALGAGYCLLNFWRCREAHCVVTGVGWAALALFTAVELVRGASVVGGLEQLVFLGILVVAFGFEAAWRARTGTNALGASR